MVHLSTEAKEEIILKAKRERWSCKSYFFLLLSLYCARFTLSKITCCLVTG
jgi:hypothetical protein